MFLFLISLDGVELGENQKVQEEYHEHAVKMACRDDERECYNHVDSCSSPFIEVFIEFGAILCECVGGISRLSLGFLLFGFGKFGRSGLLHVLKFQIENVIRWSDY